MRLINANDSETDGYAKAASAFKPPFLQSDYLETCESVVKQALAAQAQWSSEVTQGIAKSAVVPSELSTFAERAQRWSEEAIHYQANFWDSWFRCVRQLAMPWSVTGTAKPAQTETASPKTPVVETPALQQVATEASIIDPDKPEDLTAISGVGSALANKLVDAGIRQFRQIAAWSDADIERIERTVLEGRFTGRIRRDDWIGQARALHQQIHGDVF